MIPFVVQVFDILTTEKYLAVGRIVETFKQRDNRRLATARVAYNCYDLILTNINRDSFQNLYIFGCFIAILDLVQLDLRLLRFDLFFCRLWSLITFIMDFLRGYDEEANLIACAKHFCYCVNIVDQGPIMIPDNSDIKQNGCDLANSHIKVLISST